MPIYVVAAALLGIIILIFFLPIRLEVKYLKRGINDLLTIKLVIIPYILTYKSELPLLEWEDEHKPKLVLKSELETLDQPIGKKRIEITQPVKIITNLIKLISIPKISKLINFSQKILNVNRYFFKKVHCKKLKWVTEIGFTDPALTGFSTGVLWAVKGWIYKNMHLNINVDFEEPEFKVIPNFDEKKLKLIFNCIFVIKSGHIIKTGIKIFTLLILNLLSFKKGGKFFE